MKNNVVHFRLLILAVFVIFVLLLPACGSTTTPYDYDPSIEDAYDEFQADQGLSDWEIEKDAKGVLVGGCHFHRRLRCSS
jgi:hypothetical protein